MPSSFLGRHDEGGPTTQMTSKRTSHVIKFVSLGDSSPDTHGPSPLSKTAATDVPMCSEATPGWYY
jgi:hypothetical protein